MQRPSVLHSFYLGLTRSKERLKFFLKTCQHIQYFNHINMKTEAQRGRDLSKEHRRLEDGTPHPHPVTSQGDGEGK